MEIVVAAVSLCIGSFLAAYTFRKQKGLSVLSGRSFCPHCKAKISWFDNIPLLSFFVLSGKCRGCQKKISVRYPIIEFSTLAVFLAYLHFFKSCDSTVASALCSFKELSEPSALLLIPLLISILIATIVVDLESKIIPDELTFLGILAVSAFYLLVEPDMLLPAFFVGFIAAIFFLLIHLFTRGRGMGLGDVKFVILGGLVLGWPQTVVWLFLSFLTGAAVGTILILVRRAKLGREIAFGPYLAGSLLFTIIFGKNLVNMFYSL